VVTGARADVVVTDGFTGNVLLKGIEAAPRAARRATTRPAPAGGAALLGVAGPVVVCHGAATAPSSPPASRWRRRWSAPTWPARSAGQRARARSVGEVPDEPGRRWSRPARRRDGAGAGRTSRGRD
jgi:hypothetical protein